MNAGDWVTGLLIGLAGSGHCVGMCGGIAGALAMGIGGESSRRRATLLVAFNLARIGSYAAIGALAGLLGAAAAQVNAGGLLWLRLIAALLLMGMGLYLAGWWRGIAAIERAMQPLWRRLEPIGRRLLPVHTVAAALGFGAIWGWLPCGLVYSTLAWAITAGNPLDAGARMFAFGLGTVPAVLALGAGGSALAAVLRHRWFRSAAGIALIVFGIWTLWPVVSHGHAPAGAHHHMPH